MVMHTVLHVCLYRFNLEPCTSYIAENNEQRSTAYIVKTGSVSQSGDRQGFTPGWYRFTSGAGGEMPTSCPPERACGMLYYTRLQ